MLTSRERTTLPERPAILRKFKILMRTTSVRERASRERRAYCEVLAMIKVSVLYPAGDETAFDIEYYRSIHMPLVQRLCGTACKGYTIDHGIGGGAPGSHAPYVAVGHLSFESVDAFQASFGPNASEIMADIPNYTKIAPIMQISEVIT